MEFNSKKFGWGNGSCHVKQKQFVMVTNKTIVIIRNFVSIDGEPCIVGCSYLDACDLFTVPIESSHLDINKVSILKTCNYNKQ